MVVHQSSVDAERVTDPEVFEIRSEGVANDDGRGAALKCEDGEEFGLTSLWYTKIRQRHPVKI